MRKFVILICVGAVIIILGIIAYFVFAKPSAPSPAPADNAFKDTAQKFITAMSTKDGAGSYNLMTPEAQEAVGGIDTWQQKLNSSFESTNGTPKLIRTEPVADPTNMYGDKQPQRAVFSFNFDGEAWETALILTKEAAEWKVSELTSYRL